MFPINTELTKLDVAFPASVRHLMPKYEDIPKDYPDRAKWERLFNDWFFGGLKKLALTPREGVDETKALVHIRCVMGSYEPAHEHKTAAVAWLLSQWFSDGKWESK